MNDPKIVFISGANRGLGYEFARQLHERGNIIVAGYRHPDRSAQLIKLADASDRLFAVRIDVTIPGDIIQLHDFILDKFQRLDLLINNAGINLKYSTPIDEIEPEDLLQHFRVNVVGPFMVSKNLRPLLAKGRTARIVNISSQMGSISQSSGNATPYRISKAAVIMLTKNQALAYAGDGIVTVAMHPGWVKTDMGGAEAPLHPDEAVEQILAVIDQLTPDDNGSFLGFDGNARSY
jgi:NAD(P)-dependent dehydrogenase (short-subunit alcohol dehydrogenase family)